MAVMLTVVTILFYILINSALFVYDVFVYRAYFAGLGTIILATLLLPVLLILFTTYYYKSLHEKDKVQRMMGSLALGIGLTILSSVSLFVTLGFVYIVFEPFFPK